MRQSTFDFDDFLYCHTFFSYQIQIILPSKYLKTKVVLWLSLFIGRITGHHPLTSSENLVTSAQFLVAFATSGSQFQALYSLLQINESVDKKSQNMKALVNILAWQKLKA